MNRSNSYQHYSTLRGEVMDYLRKAGFQTNSWDMEAEGMIKGKKVFIAFYPSMDGKIINFYMSGEARYIDFEELKRLLLPEQQQPKAA